MPFGEGEEHAAVIITVKDTNGIADGERLYRLIEGFNNRLEKPGQRCRWLDAPRIARLRDAARGRGLENLTEPEAGGSSSSEDTSD
jgi:hypothetical protein